VVLVLWDRKRLSMGAAQGVVVVSPLKPYSER